MRVVTRHERAAKAAAKWGRQYFKRSAWYDDEKHGIFLELNALGDSPDPDEVDRVIKNGSWTRLSCSACGEDRDTVATFECKIEARQVMVCVACLAAASKLLEPGCKDCARGEWCTPA